MASSDSFLRQLSSKEAWRSTSSKRWGGGVDTTNVYEYGGDGNNTENGCFFGMMMKKRLMVVVDQTSHSKHAMLWALTHVANKGDILTLLHIVSPNSSSSCDDNNKVSAVENNSCPSGYLATSLGSLCKACRPEVEVEALVIQGPKMATVMSQVKKLEVSVLVLGQKKPSPFLSCLCLPSSTEQFMEQCINNVECLTIGVSKQSKGIGGYLISTRWHKNFWLLA